MVTDPKLRSQVDALWDKFWTRGMRLRSSSRTPKSKEKEMNEVIEFASRLPFPI